MTNTTYTRGSQTRHTKENCPEWITPKITGYKPLTTLWVDFWLLEMGTADDSKKIRDKAKEMFHRYHGFNCYKLATELVMVLNHHCWRCYETGEYYLSTVYSDLYHKYLNLLYTWAEKSDKANHDTKISEYVFNTLD